MSVATEQHIDINPIDAMQSACAGRWIVLHTRSRQEKAVARDLTAIGAACYLPLTSSVRYYGKRKARVELPLFPGYVFLYGQRDQAYLADRLGRLVGLIDVPDQDAIAGDLRQIAAALRADGELKACPTIPLGTWVEVASGPFKGIRGRVEEYGKRRRLILGVGLLGLGASLEIDESLLEAVEEPFEIGQAVAANI